MRTAFSGICLFNDKIFRTRYLFHVKQKRVGNRLNSGERERETERCSKSVLAWVINLTVGQIFMTGRERIIQDFIKMDIKIISKNLDGIIFR